MQLPAAVKHSSTITNRFCNSDHCSELMHKNNHKLRIGIVGAGNIVRTRHLPALKKNSDVEIVAVSNSTYESSERFCRENSLEGELSKLKEQFAATDQAGVKLHELEREAEANRGLFEQFLNRAKQTSEQQSLQIADARIVAPALPPLKPSRPAMSLLLGAANDVGFKRHYRLACRGFRNRTPSPAPFSSIKSMPAASKARRIAASLASVTGISPSTTSTRRIVATPTLDAAAKSRAVHRSIARAARI